MPSVPSKPFPRSIAFTHAFITPIINAFSPSGMYSGLITSQHNPYLFRRRPPVQAARLVSVSALKDPDHGPGPDTSYRSTAAVPIPVAPGRFHQRLPLPAAVHRQRQAHSRDDSDALSGGHTASASLPARSSAERRPVPRRLRG